MPGLILPSNPKTTAGGQIQFYVAGGFGPPHAWSIVTQNSGSLASIGAELGSYGAGQIPGTIDVVQAEDSGGEIITRSICIVDGPSLASIRTKCKQRTDTVNSDFIEQSEWNDWINAGAFELYDKLVTAYDNDYNVTDPYAFVADGITERYPLPPDLFKLLGVDRLVGQRWIPIHRFAHAGRNRYGHDKVRYRLNDNWLWLSPAPGAGTILRMLYVPRMPRLTRETDVVDGISGWEEYVMHHACIMAMNKRETDASIFIGLKADMAARVEEIAANRDANEPSTIVDLRAEEESGDEYME
jgi:hypothetical protein